MCSYSDVVDLTEIEFDSDNHDGDDRTSTETTEPKTSPSLLDKFYNKYTFKPENNMQYEAELDKVSRQLSSSFNNDSVDDIPGPSVLQNIPSAYTIDMSPTKSPVKDSVKKQDAQSYIQDFNFPNLNKVERPVLEPVVVDTKIISGVSVQFPVKPYPAQLSVMDKVIRGITRSENCLIESPTGSGKTLALLCSSLAWQKQERDRIDKIILEYNNFIASELPSKAQDGPSVSNHPMPFRPDSFSSPSKGEDHSNDTTKKLPHFDDSDDEHLFVKKAVKKFHESSGEDFTDKDDNLVSIHKKPKLSAQSSTTEPSNVNIPSSGSCCSPSKINSPAPDIPKVPRIIFGTRTHKQIEQVIKELRRTTYSKNVKMSILSSREHTCIRPLPNDFTSKTKHCKALMDKAKQQTVVSKTKTGSGCTYFDNKRAIIGNKAPRDVWDIEDIVGLGKKRAACPYFAARDLAESAHIIFCPYNYIIDPIIRRSIQMTLAGDIILIDEGHNIEDICRETASLTVEQINVQDCIKELEDVIKMKSFGDGDTNEMFFYFKRYLQNWEDLFENHIPLLQRQSASESVYIMTGTNLAEALGKHSIGFKQFNDFKIRTMMAISDAKNVKPEDPKKRMIPGGAGTLLENIVVIFEYFFIKDCKHLDNYIGIFTKKANERGWSANRPSMSLKISCMDPSLVFTEISSQARCVVLTSGTLTPTLSFSSELGTPFPHQLQARHVIKPDQVWVGTIDSGPSGIPLEATYKNTSNTDWQDSLGQIILWVSQKVPNGVLCFLPSYRLLEILQERWDNSGLWNKLQEYKYVFTESKNMGEYDQTMADYYAAVEEGAILFAVFRGKASEGMDFKDHQARAVITVGIPYANLKDPVIEGKMKYNDSHQNDRQLVCSRQWYNIQAFRALNQALGRCVRHKDDWGAIIMIDSRLRRDHFKQYISKWVLGFLGNQHHSWSSLTSGANNLEKFMNDKKSQEISSGT